jgi:hypothetical protein
MPRVAPNVPAERDLLCEACGYTLNGLPGDGNCPECGKSVQFSIAPTGRQPSAWERDGGFFATTAQVIFRPSWFFRSTTTRGDPAAAMRFGTIHTAIASALFAAAGILHIGYLTLETGQRPGVIGYGLVWLAIAVCTFIAMTLTTRLAVRLTTWEAAYRGFRLPAPVVQRGLAFHAAHYLPIGIIALATTAAYQVGLNLYPLYWSIHVTTYLYVLSAEVIVGAAYLFHTYWIAMRKMMYANH